MDIKIRQLKKETDIDNAIDLAMKVFMEFEAPTYPEDGIKHFREFLYGGEIKNRLSEGNVVLWGAYENDNLLGMGGIRDKSHITLLFVNGEYHRSGIGRMLMGEACRYAREKYNADVITLNASPYGVPFYEKIGFKPTDMERMEGGVIYTPMIKHLL